MVDLNTDQPWISGGLFLGLATLFLAGDGLFRILRRFRVRPFTSADRIEGFALRLLLAIAAVPWICMVYDLAGIPISRISLIAWGVVTFAAGVWSQGGIGPLRGRAEEPKPSAGGAEGQGEGEGERSVPRLLRSPAAMVLVAGSAAVIVLTLVHVSLVPERNYDALVGYDLVGKILAAEGKLRSSVFTRIWFNAQCVYAPFTSCNNGFWYIFHPAVPRLWVSLSVAAFTATMYGWVRRRTSSPTAAGLAVFLVYLPSSFLYQLTVAQTDLPAMIFTSLAVFAAVDLLQGRVGYAAPALYLLIAATGRTENVLFGAALTVLLLLSRRPGRSRSLWFTILPVAFFLFWNLFYVQVLIGYDPGAYFRRQLDFAPLRMAEVFGRAVAIIGRRDFYGEFYIVALLAPFAWILGRWKPAQRLLPAARGTEVTGALLLVSAAMFVFYMPFFYMWNEELNPLWSMEYTFKRGFLRLIPGLLAAFIASRSVRGLLQRCDGGDPS